MEKDKKHRQVCQGFEDDDGNYGFCENVVHATTDEITDGEAVCVECGGTLPVEVIPDAPPATVEWRDEYHESGTTVWVFDPFKTDEEISLILSWDGVPIEGTFCQHSYDCCGNRYYSRIRIDRTLLATYVRQHHSINV